jgi:hypothetical protein
MTSAAGGTRRSGGTSTSRQVSRSVDASTFWLLLLLLSACAGVPKEDLRSYADAYDKAQSSGILIYKAFLPVALAHPGATVSGESGGSGAGATPPPSVASNSFLPTALGPRTWVSSTGSCDEFAVSPDLMARCQALGAITEYNQVLLRLDSGENAQALQGRLQTILSFVDSVASLAAVTPGAPFLLASKALVGPLSGIIGQALTIQDRQALLAKLREGAPTVAELIALLRKDVGVMYTAQWDRYASLLDAQDIAITTSANTALRVAASHQAPAGLELTSASQDLEQRYGTALMSLGSSAPQLPKIESTFATSGGAPFTLVELGKIAEGVKGVEFAAKQELEIQQNWHAYVEALKAYDAMLAAVQDSLTTLVARSNDPLAPEGGTAQLIQSATVIRDKAQQIEQLIGAK